MKCNYCPYIVLDNSTRVRSPEAVVEEMRQGIRRWGFRSFKFRDPLFGLHRKQVFELAERIGRLPRKIQFSIETRIDLLPAETLRLLRGVGLTSITVGMETPDGDTLRRHHRPLIADDRQREFILLCRSLGIRTVAGFLIGFPRRHRGVDPAGARTTPSTSIRPTPTSTWSRLIRARPFSSRCGSRSPTPTSATTRSTRRVLKYEHLTPRRMEELVAKCFHRFYFRWQYLRDNAPLLWPALRRLGLGPRPAREASGAAGHAGRSPAAFGHGTAAA